MGRDGGAGSGPAGGAADVAAAFEDAPLLLAEYAGPELRVVAANRATRILLGGGAVIGRPLAEVAPELGGELVVETLAEVYRTGVAVTDVEWRVLRDRGADGQMRPRYLTFGARPVHHPDGSVRGVLVAGHDVTDQVEAHDAERAAGHRADHQIVLTLQRHLLPDALPVPSGARLAARYRVANAERHAGGDWFDALTLPGGRIALAVGDVVGHGPAAAAAMSRLRPVLVEALAGGASIDQAVARLDAFAAGSPATRAATLSLAVLHPATGVVQHASAGHPPPIVCGAGLPSRPLRQSPGGPLGVRAAPPTVATTTIEPGATLLLYSDGLVERAGRTLDAGLVELGTVAQAAARPRGPGDPAAVPDRVCRAVVERMCRGGHTDDVAVLAVHVLPAATAPWAMSIGAARDLADLRAQLTAWLDELGATAQDVLALELAVSEAATNALVHGHGSTCTVDVWADLDDRGTLHVTVTDQGTWAPADVERRGPDRDSRGRGLALIRAMVDELDIVSGVRGTTLTLRRALRHATSVGHHVGPTRLTRLQPVEFTATAEEAAGGPVLAVRGAVDVTTADALRSAIVRSGCGGTHPLTVDLSGATLLASAGVRLLHDLARSPRRRGNGAAEPIRLIAPAGSPARAVLALADLEHLVAEA
ncbi:MAG: SpoIIE family protein phosphatase [Pseudonocardia sp.]